MKMAHSNTLLILIEMVVLLSSCIAIEDQQHTEWYLPNNDNDSNSIKKSWLFGSGDSTDWGGVGSGHKIPQQIIIPSLLNGEHITGVSAGGQHSAVVTNNGRILTAGSSSDSGALGRSISSSGFMPVTEVESSSLPTFVKVVASQDYTLALDRLGNLWSTGTNAYGQLCQGDTASRNRFKKVQLPSNGGSIIDVVAGERHTLIRQENNGKVWGCGWNEYGQLGIGVKGKNVLSPVEIKIDDPDSNDDMINHEVVTDMAAGRGSSYFKTSSGHVYAAGTNYKGQLCLGHRDNRPLPARITDLEDGSVVESIAAGMSSIYFQLSNGQVLACGDDMNIPTRVPDVKNIKAIFSGPASPIAYLVGEEQNIFTSGSNGLSPRKNWQVPDSLLTCVNEQTAQNKTVDISTGNDHTLYLARVETTLDCLEGSAPTFSTPSPTQGTTSTPTYLPTQANVSNLYYV